MPSDLVGTGPARKFFNEKKPAIDFCKKLTAVRGSPAFEFLDMTPSQLTDAVSLWRTFSDLTTEELLQAVALWRSSKRASGSPVADVVQLCLDSKAESGVRPNYLKTLKCTLKNFTASHMCDVSTITSAQVSTWLNGNGWQPKTRLGYLKDVSTLFKFAMKRGIVTSNPCDGVDRPRLDHKPPVIFTVEQCKALLNVCRENDPALLGYICPILFGGLRPAEAQKLVVENVRDGVIDLSGAQSKLRKRRVVVVNATLRRWLDVPGVRFGNINLTKRMRKLVKLAGATWSHDVLRHSFCSYAMTKFGARAAAEMAGHSEQVLFAHYREIVSVESANEFWAI